MKGTLLSEKRSMQWYGIISKVAEGKYLYLSLPILIDIGRDGRKENKMGKGKLRYRILYIILFFLLLIVADLIISMIRNEATYLTEVAYGPFVYQDEIYVYSDLSTFPEENNTKKLDYIHSEFTDYFWIKRYIYQQFEVLPIVIGDREDSGRNFLKIQDEWEKYAAKSTYLEESGEIDKVIEQFEEFVLWECKDKRYTLEELEENNVDYGHELQKFPISKDMVKSLRKTYENRELREEDFKRNNTVYLLQAGTKKMSDFLSKYYNGSYNYKIKIEEQSDPGLSILYPDFYVGIIFYEEGKVYFCNYDNEITGQAKEMILESIVKVK